MLKQFTRKIKSTFGMSDTLKEIISVYMENDLGYKFWVDHVVNPDAIKLGKICTVKTSIGELVSGKIIATKTTYARKGEIIEF